MQAPARVIGASEFENRSRTVTNVEEKVYFFMKTMQIVGYDN